MNTPLGSCCIVHTEGAATSPTDGPSALCVFDMVFAARVSANPQRQTDMEMRQYIYFQCSCYLALPLCIVMHLTRCVSCFFFNFLFLKLQFMRMRMYTIFLALFVQRSESQFVARARQEDSERSGAAAQLVSTS